AAPPLPTSMGLNLFFTSGNSHDGDGGKPLPGEVLKGLGRPVADLASADETWMWNIDRGATDGTPMMVEIAYTRSSLPMASVETIRPAPGKDAPPPRMHHEASVARFVAQCLRAMGDHNGLRMPRLMENVLQDVTATPATDTELVIQGERLIGRALTYQGHTSVMVPAGDVLVVYSVAPAAGGVPELRWTTTPPSARRSPSST
ncbi:hypothetical protein ACFRMQ_00635, partial [Kitasatospora sp. NPDC056783]|uniref:hypothetical protein n=1 Tax=Kitasatospora sp. NPDC056783 TaxID=3345943 RepID=UPI0036A0BA31